MKQSPKYFLIDSFLDSFFPKCKYIHCALSKKKKKKTEKKKKKERLQNSSRKLSEFFSKKSINILMNQIEIFLKKGKTKNNKMVAQNIKIFLKMKKKPS